MNFSHTRVQRLAVMACMSALAFILMLFEFPVIPVVSYLKMDFSDLPILITTWLYGPVAGIVVAAIKCLLHGLMYGLSVGELLGIISNLLSSLSLLIPFAWFMRRGKGGLKRRLVMGGIVATVTLTVVMSLLNYFVLTPLYMALWGWKPSLPLPELVAFGVIPFNLIKGVLISLIFGFLAWSLRNWVATKLER
ncbi:MAG: ECF transporter S component [Limosilactobacillus gorillae]|uniref:ECF transporter S component n=1 Tax=Limosilactobacillus gorillae TaxID=1450649 RepID=UPI000B055410|nr:ECF transporter S component [Limosilactobacillus gorillae]MDO4855504.1 ECF transporter S component [Limosilactobacillus gorillae]